MCSCYVSFSANVVITAYVGEPEIDEMDAEVTSLDELLLPNSYFAAVMTATEELAAGLMLGVTVRPVLTLNAAKCSLAPEIADVVGNVGGTDVLISCARAATVVTELLGRNTKHALATAPTEALIPVTVLPERFVVKTL